MGISEGSDCVVPNVALTKREQKLSVLRTCKISRNGGGFFVLLISSCFVLFLFLPQAGTLQLFPLSATVLVFVQCWDTFCTELRVTCSILIAYTSDVSNSTKAVETNAF